VREPTGYRLDKQLEGGSTTEVCVARSEDAESWVVLKARTDRCDAGRVRREFQILRRSEGTGVVRAIGLDDDPDAPILVLESVEGIDLEHRIAQEPLEIDVIVRIAAALAEAVAHLHSLRILHGNIEPKHVLVCRDDLVVTLISFSLAHEFGMAQGPRPLDTLRYASPETSGRMARGPDFRSDLYSIGSTLYFACAGVPPFEDEDPLALVHAHIARPAPSLLSLRPDVPATLARITSKLLEKDPDHRYQSARALAADLRECEAQLAQSGRIDDEFPLGSADVPTRPLLPRRLYGREEESAQLEASYRRIADGGCESWLICGPPGIGKSALIDHLRPVLIETGGYVARGKFDLYRRERPFHGIATAFDHWAQQLLTERESSLAELRQELRRALGNLAGAVIALVPDLALVLGDTPNTPTVGPREKLNQLSIALQRLVHAVARRNHPLLLVLDDLQWADMGSLYLIEELSAARPPESFLMIGSYRDEEITLTHPLRQLLERLRESSRPPRELRLTALSMDASIELLTDTLHRDRESVRRLAEITARKTGNLPLLIQHFVYHIHSRGLLSFDQGLGWVWDERAVESAQLSDEAVVWMTQKLQALDEDSRWLIGFVSCVSDEFDASLLVELSRRSRDDIDRTLFRLSETGLIAPSSKGFRFSHDRVREAAQQLIDEHERARLHLDTARTLFANLSDTELSTRLFELADHLVRAESQIEDDEAPQWIRLLLRAGRLGLEGGVSATAERYLAVARKLLSEETWNEAPTLGTELLLASAETAVLSNRTEEGLGFLAWLDPRNLSPQEALRKRILTLRLYTQEPDPSRSVEFLLATLRAYGVHWPQAPSGWQVSLRMRRCERLIRSRQAGHIAEVDRSASLSSSVASLELLSAMGGTLYRYNTRLATIAIGQALELLDGIGVDPTSVPYLMAAYAAYRRSIGDHAGARDYAKQALTRAAERRDPSRDPRAEHVVYSLIQPWYHPRIQCVAPLEGCIEALLEVGDVDFAGSATLMVLRYRLLSGESPSRCRKYWDTAVADRLAPRASLASFGRLLDRVSGHFDGPEAPDPGAAGGMTASAPAADSYARLADLACEMLAYLVHGNAARAWQSYADSENAVTRFSPGATAGDLVLFRAIAAAELAAHRDDRVSVSPRIARKVLTQGHRELRQMAGLGPDFVHMAAFVEAELQAAKGQVQAACNSFTRAAHRATEAGFVHHAALAHERHADLLARRRRGVEATQQYVRAAQAYQSWGCKSAARRVQRQSERAS